jgi:hypothetical protein
MKTKSRHGLTRIRSRSSEKREAYQGAYQDPTGTVDEPVGTDIVVGPNAAKPLRLDIPLFVSDMSFGALSEEAKVALSMSNPPRNVPLLCRKSEAALYVHPDRSRHPDLTLGFAPEANQSDLILNLAAPKVWSDSVVEKMILGRSMQMRLPAANIGGYLNCVSKPDNQFERQQF